LRLSENQKKRQMLEDFAVRNDLYRAYLGKKQLETNLTKSVTRFLKEKVGFQQAKKDIIERLSIETNMSIVKLLNLRKQDEVNKYYQTLSKLNSQTSSTKNIGSPLRQSEINIPMPSPPPKEKKPTPMSTALGELLEIKSKRSGHLASAMEFDIPKTPIPNEDSSLDAMQGALDSEHREMNEKIDLSNQMTEYSKSIALREYQIESEYSRLKLVKVQKKKLKLRLKTLYACLLEEPQTAYDKGIFLEDIVTFLRIIGCVVGSSDLCMEFYPQEKEYILKCTDLKYELLESQGNFDEFCRVFSGHDKTQPGGKMSILSLVATPCMARQVGGVCGKSNGNLEEFLRKTISVAEKTVTDFLFLIVNRSAQNFMRSSGWG
jgi:hypothetical protein